MNNKAKITAVCGICFLLLSGLCVAQGASESVAAKNTKATKKIVDEVDRIVSLDIAASDVLAKEFKRVLSVHGISLSDKLARFEPPQRTVSDPNEIQMKRIYEPGHKIVELCRNSVWNDDPNDAIDVSLRNDLMVAIVDHSPSSMNRVKAAAWLADRSFPGANRSGIPDVSARLSNKACATAINHVLQRASIGKVDPHLASGHSLVKMYLFLEAMTAEKPSKEHLDKILAGYTSKAKAALKATSDERLIKALNGLEKALQDAEKYTELYGQVGSWRIELEPVFKAYLNAVNKEDKEAAKQLVTEDIIAHWAKKADQAWSLRENISQSPQVKEIRLQSIGQVIGTRKKGNDTSASFLIYLIFIGENGSQEYETIKHRAVKTPTGWLLGS